MDDNVLKNIVVVANNQAEKIKELSKCIENKEQLKRQVLKILCENNKLELIPEWLLLDFSTNRKKQLLHLEDPMFITWLHDSNTLAMNWFDSMERQIEFYDASERIFVELGLKKDNRKYFQKRPPESIKRYSCKALVDLTKEIKAKNTDFSVFGIKCGCGNTTFRIYGKRGNDLAEITDPISLQCVKCLHKIVVFDRSRDGYDSALLNDNIKKNAEDAATDQIFACPNCKKDEFDIALGFEQSIGIDEAKEIVRENNLKINIEDLFTWFVCVNKCRSCNKVTEVISVETA